MVATLIRSFCEWCRGIGTIILGQLKGISEQLKGISGRRISGQRKCFGLSRDRVGFGNFAAWTGGLIDARDKLPPEIYSYRIASIGSSFAACTAG